MSVWISAFLWCMVDTVKPWRKRMQHLYATVLDHFAPRWAGLTKRTQHCATWRPNARNNVARCCTNILHPFGQGFRPRQNEDTLWRQHCVLRCCPPVAKRGNIVARRADTTNVSEDFQSYFLCPGHKISVRHKCCARGKTSQHLGNMMVSANVATTMCPRFASPGQTDATCSLGPTSCNIVACDMLHNVAFVWPTLLDKLQHDPTMLHATCMLHLFGLGFILVCVVWKIIWIWHLVYCLFTNLVYYPHSWVWLNYQPHVLFLHFHSLFINRRL